MSRPGGHSLIKNHAWPKVLDLANSSHKIYTEVIGYEHHGKSNQLWIIEPMGDKYCYIKNVKTGLVI